MNLRLVSETATTITLGWDPVAGAVGYRFSAEKQAKPSHTWDPARSSVRFAKGSAWYKVEALDVPQSGSYPPAPAAGDPLPTYEAHIKPNYYPPTSNPAEGIRVVKLYHDSPSTSTIKGYTRVIATPDSQRDETIGKRSWEWWMALEMMVDPSWDSSKQGRWGTCLDPHNLSYDVGNTGDGGVGWGFGEGTSSVQLDYMGGNLYLHIQPTPPSFPEPNHVTAVPNMSKGVWHSILLQVILGRADGTVTSAGHPNGGKGRFRAWIDGSDTPIDSGDCSTLQRALNTANGTYYTQTLMGVWDVIFYTAFADQMELIISATAARVGRTLAECLADRPVKVGDELGDIYVGSGLNLGPSYYNTLSGASQRTTATFKLPASLA